MLTTPLPRGTLLYMDDPYQAGYLAYKNGQDVDSNPFKEGSDDFSEWEGGWYQAAAEASRSSYWDRG